MSEVFENIKKKKILDGITLKLTGRDLIPSREIFSAQKNTYELLGGYIVTRNYDIKSTKKEYNHNTYILPENKTS